MVKAEDDAQDETPRGRFEAFKGRLPWLTQLLVREIESHRRVDCPCGTCMVLSRGHRNSAKSPNAHVAKGTSAATTETNWKNTFEQSVRPSSRLLSHKCPLTTDSTPNNQIKTKHQTK